MTKTSPANKEIRDNPVFTPEELNELQETNELLVHVPPHNTIEELCAEHNIQANIDFNHETLIRTVMTDEEHWFITKDSPTPELLNKTATQANTIYEQEGLLGMDLRRYICFANTYYKRHRRYPDQQYWTFLHAGSYDRSGISIVGFDKHGILNHHGWMKNFRAKFAGSRYAILPPRIERTPETIALQRAYRGRRTHQRLEASTE